MGDSAGRAEEGHRPADDAAERGIGQRAASQYRAEPGGIELADLVLTQNLPRQGRLSVFPVTGPYEFSVPDAIEDYGHIVPVGLLVEDMSRHDARVSDALRHGIALRPRLYEITVCGGDIEALTGAG